MVEAYPTSEKHFFHRTSLSHFEIVIEGGQVVAQVMFVVGPDGTLGELILHQGGRDKRARRRRRDPLG